MTITVQEVVFSDVSWCACHLTLGESPRQPRQGDDCWGIGGHYCHGNSPASGSSAGTQALRAWCDRVKGLRNFLLKVNNLMYSVSRFF